MSCDGDALRWHGSGERDARGLAGEGGTLMRLGDDVEHGGPLARRRAAAFVVSFLFRFQWWTASSTS